jgi:hypothetical protein
MPSKNGKRDTQRTETGYEIPVPKRKDVMDLLGKAAKKRVARGGTRSKNKRNK